MLERFQMDQYKASRSPVELNFNLQTTQNGEQKADQKLYRCFVGSLFFGRKSWGQTCLQSTLFPDTKMYLPITLDYAESNYYVIFKFEIFLETIYSKKAGYDLVGKIWQSERWKMNDGLLLQAQRTWRSTRLGCQKASHSCSFFMRSRVSGHVISSSSSTVLEATSRGF